MTKARESWALIREQGARTGSHSREQAGAGLTTWSRKTQERRAGTHVSQVSHWARANAEASTLFYGPCSNCEAEKKRLKFIKMGNLPKVTRAGRC